LYNENNLTVIPGNHDLYAPFFSKFLSIKSVIKDYKRSLEFFKFHFDYNRKKYIRDLNNFNKYFKASFTGIHTVEESVCGYPFVKTLGDRIALIGIDSNSLPSLLKNPGCSTGEVLKNGQTALKKIFESPLVSNKIKIVLIHHYLHPTDTYIDTGISFRFIKLFNRETLVKLFDEYNVNLVLHGHFHVDHKYWLVDHKIMVLNGGATMNGQWHLINVDGDKITVL
jgi:3',5'-cyclic AMP phosphodiesterase CpdA